MKLSLSLLLHFSHVIFAFSVEYEYSNDDKLSTRNKIIIRKWQWEREKERRMRIIIMEEIGVRKWGRRNGERNNKNWSTTTILLIVLSVLICKTLLSECDGEDWRRIGRRGLMMKWRRDQEIHTKNQSTWLNNTKQKYERKTRINLLHYTQLSLN